MPPRAQPKSKPKPQQTLPAAPTQPQPDLKAVQEDLIKRLIRSGEWDRISAIFKDRLAESGWTDETSYQAKEHARQQPILNFQKLMKELTPKVEATVPADVVQEITALIRVFIDENVDK